MPGKKIGGQPATVPINGHKLREARLAAGYSQVKLGNAVGIDGSMISRLERGASKRVNGIIASNIAAAIGIKVEALLAPEATTELEEVLPKAKQRASYIEVTQALIDATHQLTQAINELKDVVSQIQPTANKLYL